MRAGRPARSVNHARPSSASVLVVMMFSGLGLASPGDNGPIYCKGLGVVSVAVRFPPREESGLVLWAQARCGPSAVITPDVRLSVREKPPHELLLGHDA